MKTVEITTLEVRALIHYHRRAINSAKRTMKNEGVREKFIAENEKRIEELRKYA